MPGLAIGIGIGISPLIGAYASTPAFSPADLNPVLWLDGTGLFTDTAKTTAASIGDPIAVWGDKGTHGNDATQSVYAKRGTLTAEGVKMDDTDDGYLTPVMLGYPFSIYVVERTAISLPGQARTVQAQNGINSLISLGRANNNTAFVGNGNVSNYHVGANTVAMAELHCPGAGTMQYLVDGISRTSDSNAAKPWGQVILGAAGSFAEPGSTTVKELVVFDHELAGDEKLKVRKYLAAKHGIGLP